MTESLSDKFILQHTSVDDLAADDWYIEHSMGGSYWFRNKKTQARMGIPLWIRELIWQSEQSAAETVRSEMRQILGIEKKVTMRPCGPQIRKPKKAKSEMV